MYWTRYCLNSLCLILFSLAYVIFISVLSSNRLTTQSLSTRIFNFWSLVFMPISSEQQNYMLRLLSFIYIPYINNYWYGIVSIESDNHYPYRCAYNVLLERWAFLLNFFLFLITVLSGGWQSTAVLPLLSTLLSEKMRLHHQSGELVQGNDLLWFGDRA